MPKSSYVDFKAVKEAVAMEHVLQHYGILDDFKGKGDSLSGPCPIHNGTNPTQFRVSISKDCWNCFGDCKRGGNVLDFVALKENVSIQKAAILLCEWFNLQLEDRRRPNNQSRQQSSQRRTNSRSDKPLRKHSKGPEDDGKPNKPLGFELQKLDQTHEYLAERGLEDATIREFGLGFCSNGSMTGRIAIPIHNGQGQLVAYAGRWPGDPDDDTPKYKLPAGFKKSMEIFNLHRAVREPINRPLLIVEGFFDCFHVWQHGYRRVVALMGSSIAPSQVDLLRHHLPGHAQAIVILDEDEAGHVGREQVVEALSAFCFVKQWPLGEEDKQPEHLTSEELSEITGGLCEGV